MALMQASVIEIMSLPSGSCRREENRESETVQCRLLKISSKWSARGSGRPLAVGVIIYNSRKFQWLTLLSHHYSSPPYFFLLILSHLRRLLRNTFFLLFSYHFLVMEEGKHASCVAEGEESGSGGPVAAQFICCSFEQFNHLPHEALQRHARRNEKKQKMGLVWEFGRLAFLL
ncbi:hypothetical protein M5K25_008404 [Dendrobium thyrsiflorum]|uniref:Uncharacterized protein n=1 Tax=Dendrobium thyrsiflorum TaxID=117978 RepID=A0ABD0VFD3_DENTH